MNKLKCFIHHSGIKGRKNLRPGFSLLVYSIAWLQMVLQALLPLAVAFAPTVMAREAEPATTSISITRTKVYTLQEGETVDTVAKQYGITVAELRKINELHTFAHGFEHLQAGDELTVPAQYHPLTEERREPDTLEEPNGHKLASVAAQAGGFLQNHGSSRDAAIMAKGMAVRKVNRSIQDWVSQFGNARIQLNTDERFSLKNSQLDLLHPWFETPNNLVFSQGSIHRTDDRTQMNLGTGWRHFTVGSMFGSNLFLDYDLSRDHARAGVGSEYWRDFMKFAANVYVGLTGWKQSPDVEDYKERPANGWDLRAEGWLPAYPQLGGKLAYEQYYGDDVGLFGRDDRQKNPHALTMGISWTPFPLLTLSAEQRQGKSGENDTRLGLNMRWEFNKNLAQQTDGAEVAQLRTLSGSRHDFVERNNNIVLEYKKEEVIRLFLPDSLQGKGGENLPLSVTVYARHGLRDIIWDKSSLVAAGGNITGQGTAWQITLPTMRNGSNNQYPLSAIAHDQRGNASTREMMVLKVNASSDGTTADEHNSTIARDKDTYAVGDDMLMTVTLKDANGNGISGKTPELTTSAVNITNAIAKASAWTEAGNGVYTRVYTASKEGTGLKALLHLDGWNQNVESDAYDITTPATDVDASQSSITANPTTLVADGVQSATLKLTLKDKQGNPVTGKTVSHTIKPAGDTSIGKWTDHKDGTYTATFTAGITAGVVEIMPQVDGKNAVAASKVAKITLTMKTMNMLDLPDAEVRLQSGEGNHTSPLNRNTDVMPKVVFPGAQFRVILDKNNIAKNDDYIFTANSTWFSVAPDGVVTIGHYNKKKPEEVTTTTITATPKSSGFQYTLDYKPQIWLHAPGMKMNHTDSVTKGCIPFTTTPLPDTDYIVELTEEWGLVSQKDGFDYEEIWVRHLALDSQLPRYMNLRTGEIKEDTSHDLNTILTICVTNFDSPTA